MRDIKLEEVIKKKKETEKAIGELLQKFSDETNMIVETIKINDYARHNMNGDVVRRNISVEIRSYL